MQNTTDSLEPIPLESSTHQELPSLIHARTYVPYLVGRPSEVIASVELKRSGWNLKLTKVSGSSYILAEKGKSKWLVHIVEVKMKLRDTISEITRFIDQKITRISDDYGALPVMAVIANDSASFLSTKTLTSLSLDSREK